MKNTGTKVNNSNNHIWIMIGLVAVALTIGQILSRAPSDKSTHRMDMEFEGEWTTEERALLREATIAHISSWESDFGRKIKYVRIRIVVDIPGSIFGQCSYPENRIYLEAGRYLETPALYHELCHANIDDNGHSKNGWKRWNERTHQIAIDIALKRNGDPDNVPKALP